MGGRLSMRTSYKVQTCWPITPRGLDSRVLGFRSWIPILEMGTEEQDPDNKARFQFGRSCGSAQQLKKAESQLPCT